jgi:hypothetical protein
MILCVLLPLKIHNFSSSEWKKIDKEIRNEILKDSNDGKTVEMEKSEKLIKQILKNDYFDERFCNFDKVMGSGGFGMVFSMNFLMFEKVESVSFPVAVKILFKNSSTHQSRLMKYITMMIPIELIEYHDKGDNTIIDFKQYYSNLLLKGVDANSDIQFLGMIYEAAILKFKDEETGEDVEAFVIVSQLGTASLVEPITKLGNAETNLMNFKRSVLQIIYGVSSIHSQNDFHGDLKLENLMRIEYGNSFDVFVIDFDLLNSFQQLRNEGRLITENFYSDKIKRLLKTPDQGDELTRQKIENYLFFEQENYIYVRYLADSTLLADWMKIPNQDISPKIISKTENPEFLVPLSENLWEETMVLVNTLIEYFQVNSGESGILYKTKDEDIKLGYDFLVKLSQRSAKDFKMTSESLFIEFNDIFGNLLELSNKTYDPNLMDYSSTLKSMGIRSVKDIMERKLKDEKKENKNNDEELKKENSEMVKGLLKEQNKIELI